MAEGLGPIYSAGGSVMGYSTGVQSLQARKMFPIPQMAPRLACGSPLNLGRPPVAPQLLASVAGRDQTMGATRLPIVDQTYLCPPSDRLNDATPQALTHAGINRARKGAGRPSRRRYLRNSRELRKGE